MLRHVVTWKLASDDLPTRLENSTTIAAELQALVPIIPEIRSLTVGSNAATIAGNWDLAMIADYDDEAALKAYIEHPEHQRVAGIIRPLVAQRSAVDFLI